MGEDQLAGTAKNPTQMRPLDATERGDDHREMKTIPMQTEDEINMRPSGPIRSRAHPAVKIVNPQHTSASKHCPLDATALYFYPAKELTKELRQHDVTALDNRIIRIDEPEEPAKKAHEDV